MRRGAIYNLMERAILAVQPPGSGAGSHSAEGPYPETAHRSGILDLAFGGSTVDEALSTRVRAAQVSGVVRFTPFMMAANIMAVLATVYALAESVPWAALLSWAAAVLLFSSVSIKAWMSKQHINPGTASPDLVARTVRHTTQLAVLWAVVPIATFWTLETDAAWLVSCLMTGLICCGAFALATIPKAALRWVVIVSIGSLVALLIQPGPATWPMIVLLVLYACIVSLGTIAAGCLFVSHFVGEAELAKRGELIALLLNDFEETASDWLWECDTSGFLVRTSERFRDVSGRSADELQAIRMVDLAQTVKTHEARHAAWRLEKQIAGKTAFRGLVIGVDVNGEERFWSLSGRPCFSSEGDWIGFRGVGTDVTEETKSAALIAHLAEHDALTGIGNRSWFLRRVKEKIEQTPDLARQHITVMLLDLDNFKVVNDTSGQPAGDKLLRHVSERFKAVGRGRAEFARFGGDEFAIVGEFESQREAEEFAARLIKVAKQPFEIGLRSFSLSATIGFAIAPDHGNSVDDLLRNADIALFQAKRLNRGSAMSFRPVMEREVRTRREIEADLRKALADEALRVEFQPIIDARTGEVVSSEVLVRWLHPERGEIPPSEFVPIAEEAGLMLPLGSWVLQRACAVAVRYPKLKSIAVNLSPMQFMSSNLPDLVRDALAATGFEADKLVLEVTESVLIRDADAAREMMTSLRELGVRIALDDFGTGYSSLSYLRQYRFDKIKIDKCFVDEIGITSDGLAIIAAVIALAHNLGLEVTAEGVEKKFQAEALRTLGCDTLQGFYFGRPEAEPVMSIDPELIESINRTPPIKLAGFGS